MTPAVRRPVQVLSEPVTVVAMKRRVDTRARPFDSLQSPGGERGPARDQRPRMDATMPSTQVTDNHTSRRRPATTGPALGDEGPEESDADAAAVLAGGVRVPDREVARRARWERLS